MITSVRLASRQALRRSSRQAAVRGASRRALRPAAMAALRSTPSVFYSTERVLELRNGKSADQQPKVLYDPTKETENCGVGLIASLKSTPSRHVVDVADEMLVRMSHRGGCGCDPASGDGAGTLCKIETRCI